MRQIVYGILLMSCFYPLLYSLTIQKSAIAEEKSQLVDIQPNNRQTKFCSQDLSVAIEEIINRPKLARSRWGIEIQTLTGESLYSLEDEKFFTPASSAKLLVSAAGLLEFGTDYQIKTPIYSVGNAPNLTNGYAQVPSFYGGVRVTSLRIEAKGDPSITTKSLKDIVHQLQLKGIKRIENLIVDDSYFGEPQINPTWEWIDVHSDFATAVNSAILNQNAVTLTLLPQQIGQPVKFFWSDAIAAKQWQVINQAITGNADIDYDIKLEVDLGKPVLRLRGELAVNEPPDIWDLAIVDPPQYFLDSLRSQLEQAGIRVTRGTVIDRPQPNKSETELGAIYSPAMSQIIAEINQESNNLYAEVLGKLLAQKLGVETPTDAINQSLAKIGIQPDEYVLVDASGLSRQNLVTPQTLVKILSAMLRSPSKDLDRFLVAKSYRQSLAVAGISGTLKERFRDTPIQGNLWGKTGTLTGVATLSGYLYPQHYPAIVFSIIVNNSELNSSNLRQAIDEIIVILNNLHQC